MRINPRRVCFRAMLAAIVLLPLVTLWQIAPSWRQHSIRSALIEGHSPKFWWPPSWRSEFILRRNLLEPVTLKFEDEPLDRVLNFLRIYRIDDVVLDEAALRAQGITRDTPVSFHITEVRLDVALNLLLSELESACLVQGDTLLVTTQTRAGEVHAAPVLQTPASVVGRG